MGFDADEAMIHVTGRTSEENAFVRVGSRCSICFSLPALLFPFVCCCEGLAGLCWMLAVCTWARVQMHAFHTLDLELNREVKIEKGSWDSAYLDRLHVAAEAAKNVRRHPHTGH